MLVTGLRSRCLHAHLEDRFVRAWRIWVGQLPPHGVHHRLQEQVAELADHHLDHHARLPAFAKWQLPDTVVYVEAIPRTSVGKIDKKALRAAHADTYHTTA